MKKMLLVCLFWLNVGLAIGQKVAIELSLEWKKQPHFLRIDSPEFPDSINTPYLVATYRNLSDQYIYFRKFIKDELPRISGGFGVTHLERPLREDKKEFSFLRFPTGKFLVELSANGEFSNNWMITTDTLKNESKIAPINDGLEVFYRLMGLQRFLNLKHAQEQLAFFNYPMKTTISWTNAIERLIQENFPSTLFRPLNYQKLDTDSLFQSDWTKNQLCFLNPYGELVEKINLLGFKLLGGNYMFYIEKPILPDYFVTGPIFNESSQHLTTGRISLPSRLGRYQLYSGYFLSNRIGVKFEQEKDDTIMILGYPKKE